MFLTIVQELNYQEVGTFFASINRGPVICMTGHAAKSLYLPILENDNSQGWGRYFLKVLK